MSPHVPSNGPQEPAQPPEGRAGPSMPPDPFTPADMGFAFLVTMLHGLRRNGAGLLEACLTVAGVTVLNGIAAQAQQPPEHT